MFVLSWIRSSDAQASNKTNSAITSGSDSNNTHVDQNQDDWVFLPSDHDQLMEASCSNLDLLSASTMTLHPASSRTRTHTSSASPITHDTSLEPAKSRRQLKSEYRRQLALEQLERKPRYDPFIAKLRDQEFQRAKMAKLALRSGRIMSSTTGGAHSMKSRGSSGAAGAGAAPRSASANVC
ncbi:hypothetical protein BGZ74_004387 [Mortierella antarctica]|nr:hypothetical protein BGZ74_004387 [Mortierella antarctica]